MFSFSHPPARFIPAYAGNSALACSRRARRSVHPRLRGELILVLRPALIHIGSSPLTRGTRVNPRWVGGRIRFIPAYAGNSAGNIRRPPKASVHPRLRGELRLTSENRELSNGSSPLTRGTQYFEDLPSDIRRFIPAYAGNSLKQGIEHLTNSSKDFLSGKYAKNPETVLNHFKNSSLD